MNWAENCGLLDEKLQEGFREKQKMEKDTGSGNAIDR